MNTLFEISAIDYGGHVVFFSLDSDYLFRAGHNIVTVNHIKITCQKEKRFNSKLERMLNTKKNRVDLW